MKTTETKQKFIVLRAAGYSFRRISKELRISPSTAKEWESSFRAEVDRYKSDELTELYERYHATKEERIKTIGENLREIEKIMKEKEVFKHLKPAQLLTYHIKYLQLLAEEYRPDDPEKHLSVLASEPEPLVFRWMDEPDPTDPSTPQY